LLANIALHGLEAHLRAQFPAKTSCGQAGERVPVRWKPQVIRYGDDFVVLHRDRAVIEHCQRLAEEWLQGVGLELNGEKNPNCPYPGIRMGASGRQLSRLRESPIPREPV
jgi:RNA-directed DNA polymerase